VKQIENLKRVQLKVHQHLLRVAVKNQCKHSLLHILFL